MDLGWPHRRCILCSRELSEDVPFSRAHLIPQSIGGFVWAWTKCKECNERVGSDIEAAVVKDDTIVCSVNVLREQLPDVAAKFDARTKFVARSEQGLVQARRRGDEFEIVSTKDEDGALRQSKDEARAGLEKRLRREDRSPEEIEAALAIFDGAAEGVPFEIAGATYTHGSVGDFGLPFDGKPVSDAFPSLIAFHFLALVLGPSIFDPRLDELRAAIRRGDARSAWHVAEGGITRTYTPTHLVGRAQGSPHVVVRVQLFGWSVWRVHFPKIVAGGEPEGILLDLAAKEMRLAQPKLVAALQLPS